MTEQKPITVELIKAIWPVAAILFSLGMTWASLNSKIDTVIVAQKETNDVAKTLTVIVGKHDTLIAVLQNRVEACYAYCASPQNNKPVSYHESDENTQKLATTSNSNESKPATVNVKSESKSTSQSSEQKPEVKEEEKKGPLEIIVGEVEKLIPRL